MSTHAEAEAIEAIREAAGVVGLAVESPTAGPGEAHDLTLINPAGGQVAINIKRMSLVSVDGLADRIKAWDGPPGVATVIGVLVADRVTEEAREILRTAGWGWLDLRGHLRIVGQGLFVDTDVPALKKTPGRTDPLAGHVGIEVAEPAHDHNGRAATVRVAPAPTICSHRVDATSWTKESWPLAQPLFVALDLAQDPGRGREILAGWIPP